MTAIHKMTPNGMVEQRKNKTTNEQTTLNQPTDAGQLTTLAALYFGAKPQGTRIEQHLEGTEQVFAENCLTHFKDYN